MHGIERSPCCAQMIKAGVVKRYSGHTYGCKFSCKVKEGPVACQLGHQRMIKLFLASDAKYGLFFEDDVITTHDVSAENLKQEMTDRFAELSTADPAWDMLYLGRCYDDCRKPQKIVGPSKLLVEAKRPLCLHAYVLTKSGAQKVLDSLWPMKNNVDKVVSELSRGDNKILKAYVRSPSLFNTETKAFASALGTCDVLARRHTRTCVTSWHDEIILCTFQSFTKEG